MNRRSAIQATVATIGTALAGKVEGASFGERQSKGTQGGEYKLALILQRRADVDEDSFQQKWIAARTAADAAGLLRRVYNIPLGSGMPIKTGATQHFDGIEENWFVDHAAAKAYLAVLKRHFESASEPWSLVDRQNSMIAGGRGHIVWEAERAQSSVGPKILILSVRREQMSTPAFRDYWINHHGGLVMASPGARERHRRIEYCPLDPIANGPLPAAAYDGLATIQFEGGPAFQTAMADDYYKQVLAPDEPNFSNAGRSYGGPVREVKLMDAANP
ncbi:EthD domain-containing protein [Sphingobium sp.]|uniref:EthD domain-containing protein n=1 Tax=Sphingobium sp. TaxID=1912891 RepID=UPI0028BDD078|nr:EthD domain-containing protein [Sphingobium sp.]